MSSDPIWFKEPRIIFNRNRLTEFFPNPSMKLAERLNALVRLGIYLSVLLTSYTMDYNYLYIAIITMIGTYFMYNYKSVEEKKIHEKFISNYPVAPTVNNPFMNANLITDDRRRPPAKLSYNDKQVRETIEDKFNHNLYRDVADLYGKNNSQRQFYTMPATTIPNNQTAFAKWLYNTGTTCKEEGIKCAPEWSPMKSYQHFSGDVQRFAH